MTDRLTEIRARLDAATPGPWVVTGQEILTVAVDGQTGWESLVADVWHRDRDADLIAHAPADIAWLLDEVERLRAQERGPVHMVTGPPSC